MKKNSILFSAIFVLLICFSCWSPECKTNNKIFETYSPDAKEYKDELLRRLNSVDKSKLTYSMAAYWTEKYKTTIPAEYIRVHIAGKDICADMILAIKDSKKGIENILKTQMMGYRGAELTGLQFDIYQDSSKTEFVFKEISGIID